MKSSEDLKSELEISQKNAELVDEMHLQILNYSKMVQEKVKDTKNKQELIVLFNDICE